MTTPISSDVQNRIQWSLFSLRLSVFIVMLMWTLDKFVNPGHSARIFEHFYGISGSTDIVAYVLGALQMILVLAFAPVLQSFPNGNKSPKIRLPFMLGLEYSIVTSIRPTTCSTIPLGLD